MELNFEGLEMQKWNIPTNKAQRVHEKMGYKSSYWVHSQSRKLGDPLKNGLFFVLSADDSKKPVLAKYLGACEISHLALGFSATIRNLPALEQTGFWYFCYPQYLTNGNSEAYEQYHFLKKPNNIFQAQFNIFPKLRLVFCFHQQKTQKLSHFWHSSDHNPRSKHNS